MPTPQGESLILDIVHEDEQAILINKIKESATQFENLENKLQDRNSVVVFLSTTLPDIANFYHQQLEKVVDTRIISREFIIELGKLQNLAHRDFLETGNSELLDVFLCHRISPLSKFKIRSLLNQFEPKEVEAAITLQRFFQNVLRMRTHSYIFKHPPQTTSILPKGLNSHRLETIIGELTTNHAAISPIQHHWTNLDNFINILRNNYFFGNEILKKNNIFFQPNSIGSSDIKNGDSKVICFCPYLVDHEALLCMREMKLKDKIIRLSLNLKQIEAQWKYNQFFKLRDLCSPMFFYAVKINDELSIEVRSINGAFTVIISLMDYSVEVELYKNDKPEEMHETIFYGDLTAINSFCLTQLLRLVAKTNDPLFIANFSSYLHSLNNDEIKKILVIFAQSLTVYGEYNFNGSLKLTPNLISAIHLVGANQTFHFGQLSSEHYHQLILGLLGERNLDFDVPATTETIVQQTDRRTLRFYGNQIDMERRTTRLIDQDFSKIPAENFANNHYIETRPNLAPSSSPDTQLKFGY